MHVMYVVSVFVKNHRRQYFMKGVLGYRSTQVKQSYPKKPAGDAQRARPCTNPSTRPQPKCGAMASAGASNANAPVTAAAAAS